MCFFAVRFFGRLSRMTFILCGAIMAGKRSSQQIPAVQVTFTSRHSEIRSSKYILLHDFDRHTIASIPLIAWKLKDHRIYMNLLTFGGLNVHTIIMLRYNGIRTCMLKQDYGWEILPRGGG